MKHLHVIKNDKFTDNFILFIKNNFKFKNHFFLIIGDPNKSKNEVSTLNYDNIIKLNTLRNLKNLFIFEKSIYKYNKIHFHGLFNWNLVKILYLQPWLLKKSNWIIWGGDLYYYEKPKNAWRKKLHEFTRKKVIKRFNEITSFIPGDYDIAKKIYNTKAIYHNAMTYNISADNKYLDKLIKENKKENKKIVFQVGNSADSRNNHFEILKKLKEFKNRKIEIIVPLSYWDKKYRKKVINYGKKHFGTKFKPLTEFYGLKDYLKILNQIDVGIFNHKHQQGLGNITKLLRLGKKVYLNSDVSTWDYFKDIGVKVYDTKKIYDENFESIINYNSTTLKNNIKAIKKIRSTQYRVKQWKKILNT